MKMLLYIFSLFIMSLGCCAQGLQFQGSDYLIEERTSYSVFERQTPYFQNEFSVSFDISVNQPYRFGYIFRLKDKDTNRTYNFTFEDKYINSSVFRFNNEGKDNLATIEIDNNDLGDRQWLSVSFSFFINDNLLIINVNDKEYTVKGIELSKKFYPHISFGKDEHVIDVPAFALRNLVIKGESREYKFPFTENTGEDVHNIDGTVIGQVKNPVWMINAAYYWKHRHTYRSQHVSGVNFNAQSQQFLFFNSDSIVFFDIRTNSVSSKKYTNPLPVDMKLGTNFVDGHDKLYVYEVTPSEAGKATMASLAIGSDKWDVSGEKYLPMQLHHHTGYYDRTKGKYIIFGGFGDKRYNKEFLSYDVEANRWDTLAFTGDRIAPRYFSGWTVNSKNQLLLFGGMGNESGDQTIGRRYFYDLYQIDLNSGKIVKLWDLQWKDDNIVPARNMVMLNDSSFYALCYPEHIANSFARLYKFSVADGSYELVGDSVPILSEKITTNANLYYNLKLNEFYCTIQEFEDDGSSVTNVYSLSSPPISKEELIAFTKSDGNLLNLLWLLLIIPVGGLVFCFSKMNKRKIKNISPEPENPPFVSSYIEREDEANAIYLFGQFTVYDAAGKDITYMFSSRLERAFLLILLHSCGDGISSQQLSEALWPDRTELNVKNLRGVTINHLRKILAEMKGIELIFDKGFFRIVMTDECYCDYFSFMSLIRSDNSIRADETKDILSRGEFLKSADATLFGAYKKEVDNIIGSVLPIDIEKAFDKGDYHLAIHLSDILSITIPLSEKALGYTIASLYMLNAEDQAKIRYALFTTEYKKANGEDYPQSLSHILKKMQK